MEFDEDWLVSRVIISKVLYRMSKHTINTSTSSDDTLYTVDPDMKGKLMFNLHVEKIVNQGASIKFKYTQAYWVYAEIVTPQLPTIIFFISSNYRRDGIPIIHLPRGYENEESAIYARTPGIRFLHDIYRVYLDVFNEN